MAFFFGDSFDCYALPADALLGYWEAGTTAFSLTSGRFAGSRAALQGSNGAWLVKSSGSNDAVHHIACAFQQGAALTGTTLGFYFQLTDGTTNQCCIVFRSDGAILLTSATPNGTILASYAGAVTATNTWYAFEFEVVINNTTGSFAVRKNGNTSNDFSATSLNTRPGTNSYANKLTFGQNASVASQALDDLLWRSDAASVPWVGDIRCYTRRPAGDAAVQWSQSGTGSLTQTQGSNTTASTTSTTIRFTPYTTYPGLISGASVAVTTLTVNMKCAIFADNAGQPGTVLATATAPASTAPGTVQFTFSPALTVAAGEKIWLGAITDATCTFSANTGTTSFTGAGSYATFPQPNPVATAAIPMSSSITYTLSAGNYALVQEQQQDAAASYVYSSAPGAQDLYTLSDISSMPSTIVGVTTRGLLTKSDAGTRLAAVQLRSGATTVQAAGALSNSAWGWLWRTDTTDPATGTPWTVSGVAAAQIGAQVTG